MQVAASNVSKFARADSALYELQPDMDRIVNPRSLESRKGDSRERGDCHHLLEL